MQNSLLTFIRCEMIQICQNPDFDIDPNILDIVDHFEENASESEFIDFWPANGSFYWQCFQMIDGGSILSFYWRVESVRDRIDSVIAVGMTEGEAERV